MFNKKSLKCIESKRFCCYQVHGCGFFFVCSNVNDGFRNRLNHKIKIFSLDRQQMDKTNCLTLAAHARVA